MAAGHASRGGNEIQVDRPGTILKMLDKTEHQVYQRLRDEYYNDPVYGFTPQYHGDVQASDENGKPVEFIRIANLLTGFHQPKVIDVKLGVRTFVESECDNPKPRPDLYKRMAELYPDEATAEERAAEAITKYRWMTARDARSTIGSLGFRIDGIAGYRRIQREQVDEQLKAIATPEDVASVLAQFAQEVALDADIDVDQPDDEHDTAPLEVAQEVLMHLEKLHEACKESAFVKRHEFIGSSLLIIADAYGHSGVSWIDFAKTVHPPEGIELTHTNPWSPGNHEDGILTGLENLVSAWRVVVENAQNDGGNSQRVLSRRDSKYVNVHGRSGPCGCLRWRRTSEAPQRRDRRKFTVQSDLNILSALPAFQGSRRQLKDERSLRGMLREVGDMAATTAAHTVEAAAHAAMVAHQGVIDVADSVLSTLQVTASGSLIGQASRNSIASRERARYSTDSTEPQLPEKTKGSEGNMKSELQGDPPPAEENASPPEAAPPAAPMDTGVEDAAVVLEAEAGLGDEPHDEPVLSI